MEFKKMTLENIDEVRPFCSKVVSRTCDFSVGGLFIWREMYDTEFAIEDGTFFSLLKDKDGKIFYNLPLSDDIEGAVKKLVSEVKDCGDTVRFCTIPQEYTEIFEKNFSQVKISSQTEFFDYMYTASDMITLSGKRFNGQRNQISQFKRNYESYEFKEINELTVERVSEFYKRFLESNEPKDETAICESWAIFEILNNFDKYKMLGGVLFANDEVVGFSIGEIINDTLIIHVEKADRSYKGAYQMLFREFSEKYGKEVMYINREDDMGDEGLRRAKESYHPVALLEKYLIEIS